MRKNAHASAQRMFIAHSKNRPFLAGCPADIVSAAFYLDLKLRRKVMKLCIRNRSDHALTAMTVLARYLDKQGQVMGETDGFIVLRFSGIYCAPHHMSPSSKTVILPYQDISGIEAYITSVTFENGETQEFSTSQYAMTPPQEMPESRMSEAECRLLRRRMGDNCVFIPRMLEGEAWLCACGAVCLGEQCSGCGMKRGKAAMLADPKKSAVWLRRQRTRDVVLKIIPYAVSLALFMSGVLVLRDYAVEYIEVTLPADRLAVTRQYIAEHRYREALGYSVSKNHSLMYTEILDAAVEYYCGEGSYAEAAAFEKCRETPSYEPIYESAARSFIKDGTEDALPYALSVEDDALYDQVLRRLSEEAMAAGRRRDACHYALNMRGKGASAYADEVLYTTIAALLEQSSYEEAVAVIGRLTDRSRVPALCRGIEQELLAMGKYDDAFAVASITGDTTVFALAYPSANLTTIRNYYDKFSVYMSASMRREYLASSLDAGGSVVCINAAGEALDSAAGVLCGDAVSVAAGAAHVLVLQKDGTVRAFGDNAHGQLGCDGLTDAVAVAAGDNHSLVLLADGTVRAFGDNTCGQCSVSGWTNVIAIAAGARHSAAVTDSGTALAAGSNASGQCSLSGYGNVISIAAGDYSTVLIFRDGSIHVQGNIAVECFAAREWDDVVRVAVGNGHLIALTSGNSILCAGAPNYAGTEAAADWSRVREIACGAQSVYAIDVYGKILSCGSDVPPLSGSGWEEMTK